MMMSKRAARQRLHRARLRAGQIVVTIVVQETELIGMLTTGGLLHPDQSDDPEAVRAALTRQVELLCRISELNCAR